MESIAQGEDQGEERKKSLGDFHASLSEMTPVSDRPDDSFT